MEKNPFVPALILGVATLVLSLMFPKVPTPPGVQSVIIELEFARSASDVYRVTGFGVDKDAGSSDTSVQAIRAHTAHDRWFIFAYVLFLALSCALVWKLKGSPLLLAGMALALGAGAFDFVENRQILFILDHMGADFSAALSRLHLFTWFKWSSIALAFCTLAPFAWTHSLWGKLLALGSVLTIVAALAAATMKQPVFYSAFAGMVMLSFLLLFVWELSYGRKAPQ